MTSIHCMCVVAVLCLAFTGYTDSEIITFSKNYILPNSVEYLEVPKYVHPDAPSYAPGNGQSYVDLSKLKIFSSCDNALADGSSSFFPSFGNDDISDCDSSATLEFLLFEEPTGDKYWMDYWPDRQICCTDEMVAQGMCSGTGKVYIPLDLPGLFSTKLTIIADKTSLPFHSDDAITRHNFKESGIYVYLFAVCDEESSIVVIDGAIESLDPYGYLPADLYGNMPFYGVLSLAYSAVGIVWVIACAYNSKQLIPLQVWISVVLSCGLIEAFLIFSHYLHWNDYGTAAISLGASGNLAGILKRTFSRIIITLVSLGYGIVRPSVGDDMKKVLYLGLSYLILSIGYALGSQIDTLTKSVGDDSINFLPIAVFSLAVVDTLFYIWIFSSINNLMLTLAVRKQAVKYILYRNFRAVLFVSLFFTIIWALWGSAVLVNDGNGDYSNWKYRWSIDALWESTYYVILVVIAYMWGPSRNSEIYSQFIELSQLDLEDDDNWNKAQEVSSAVNGGCNDKDIDGEFGGRLDDDDDPFIRTGALDTSLAITKKA